MTMISENGELLFIISPYRGVKLAKNKVHAICREAIMEGFVPIAPHGYFTLFLDDDDADERIRGIAAGHVLLTKCDRARIYGEHITEGMKLDIDACVDLGIILEQKIGNEVKTYDPGVKNDVPAELGVDCTDEVAYNHLKNIWVQPVAEVYFDVLVKYTRAQQKKAGNKITHDQAREQVKSNIWKHTERYFDWQTRKRIRELFRKLLS